MIDKMYYDNLSILKLIEKKVVILLYACIQNDLNTLKNKKNYKTEVFFPDNYIYINTQ